MKYLLTIFCLGFPNMLIAQTSAGIRIKKEDKVLSRNIKKELEGFNGEVGVFVYNTRTRKGVEINADSIFPTASMVKVPILVGVFDQVSNGKLPYDTVLTYKNSLHYDNGIVGSLRDSAQVPLSYLMHLMTSLSDNTGSLWLQSLAGGGKQINAWLEGQGFPVTRVNSRTPGRETAQRLYGWGQTSPREMATLLYKIREGNVIDAASSERMYRFLRRQFWDGQGLSQIPPSISVAAKNGAVNQAKSEVVFVHAPHGEYVYCIATKNQADQRWKADNEGYALLTRLSRIIWSHFEPKYRWKPAPGMEKLHY